jgi:serine protease
MNTTQARPSNDTLRIAVKLRRHGGEAPRHLSGLEAFLEKGGVRDALRLMPLIESLDARQLADLVDRAVRNDPTYVPADFSSWQQVVCPAGMNPDELARAMRALDDVETAYVLRPLPPPVSPADDPRSTNQGYLDAAPNGIDARFAWGIAGGDGSGIGFVDLEQGWNLGHEDLAAAGITLISGLNKAYYYHGTSVLGEVLMVDNTLGGVGIAPAASGRVVSQWRTAASYNTADAILDAVAHMAFGDVLLLEAQETDPVGGEYFWPVEIVDGNYDAIRLATALGIVVVEAGCNGGYDLDAYTNLAGKKIFDRNTPADFRDSGAIMVGAATSAAPHSRLSFSNYGSRIDCYAWGESIDTTTTNSTGTDNTAYTTGFNGTSGASPIIVGAALLVQSVAEVSPGYRFSPLELRILLTTDGTPSANPADDRIGVMPDLHAIITNDRINLAADLYLRDYVGDSGDTTSGTVSSSPDLIVRQAAVADPQGTWGAGSGLEDDPALSQEVLAGQDHFVYARVLNRGGTPASAVSVDVYWSPPSTLVTPNLWTLIGTATLASVPTGNVVTVSDGITWPSGAIPGQGHYCFVGVSGNAQDPKPSPATFSDFDQYLTYVENNNNIVWRNFDVVVGPPAGSPPGFYKQKFIVPGAFDTSRAFELQAIGRLPAGSRAFLEMPAWLADSLRPHVVEVKYDTRHGTARMPLHPAGVLRLGTAILHARSRAACTLLVEIADKSRRAPYDFAVRQLYKQQEVGRITWRFAALKKACRQPDQREKVSAKDVRGNLDRVS